MNDQSHTAEIQSHDLVRRAIRIATGNVGSASGTTSFAAFSALGTFLTADDGDLDVVTLRNAALVVVDGLGTNYRIGCEAFVANLRHWLLFSLTEPDDEARARVTEVDRRYARFVAFAAELVAARTATPIGGR